MDPSNPAVRSRAEKIYAEMETVFQPRHTVRKVELASFKHLDHTYYEETTRALEREGFRPIADIENTTLSEVYPHNRTALRLFLHREELASAACYNMRFTGWMRFITWILRLPRDIRVVEIETEFDDGSFVSTTTAVDNHLDPEPGIVQSKFDPSTPIPTLVRTHFGAVARYRTERPDATPLRLTSYNDLLASQDRQQELKSEYRRQIGFLTEAEMVRMAGPKREELGRAIYAAMQELHGGAPTP